MTILVPSCLFSHLRTSQKEAHVRGLHHPNGSILYHSGPNQPPAGQALQVQLAVATALQRECIAVIQEGDNGHSANGLRSIVAERNTSRGEAMHTVACLRRHISNGGVREMRWNHNNRKPDSDGNR